MTHYVADSHGFRHVTPDNTVEVFPDLGQEYDNGSDKPRLRKVDNGILVPWKDLYFPVGCGAFEGGAKRDFPVIRLSSEIVSIEWQLIYIEFYSILSSKEERKKEKVLVRVVFSAQTVKCPSKTTIT